MMTAFRRILQPLFQRSEDVGGAATRGSDKEHAVEDPLVRTISVGQCLGSGVRAADAGLFSAGVPGLGAGALDPIADSRMVGQRRVQFAHGER